MKTNKLKVTSLKFKVANSILLYAIFFILFSGCTSNDDLPIPKPKGYLRVDLPQKSYVKYDTICPFTFYYPNYARIEPDEFKNSEPCWINIYFPSFSAKIHLSYKEVKNNIGNYLEDSRDFVIKHQVKASAINEQVILRNTSKVYGLVYDIEGNTASSIQFYVTDSTTHFLRGALYFNSRPNADSLAPYISFIRKDVFKLLETLEWKNQF